MRQRLQYVLLTLATALAGTALVSCMKSPDAMTALPYNMSGAAYAPSFSGDNGLLIQKQTGAQGPKRSLDLGPAGRQELWVLARGTANKPPQADKDFPGSGALMTEVNGKKVPMPLKHTEVHARIDGYLGEVNVTQQFLNPYSGKIEAVYIFPLPQNAAVNEFIMMIGERQIRGIIRERQEAERIYKEARRQGYVASLLTEERPNVFTQSVANIEPGREIDVSIRYFQTLEYVDGWYEFVFPMVVGPRFNPPGTTDGIRRHFPGRGRPERSEERGTLPEARRAHEPRHRPERRSQRRFPDRGVPMQQPQGGHRDT